METNDKGTTAGAKLAIKTKDLTGGDNYHFHEDFIGLDDWWRRTTYWLGSALLTLAVLTVMSGIFQGVNNPPWTRDSIPRFVEFILFWSMLFWIAMLEGCQISVVGLQGHDPETFRESHPRAYKCCKYVHNGPNVERFLVGRQFLLLFNGFLVSRIGGGWGELFQFSLFGWTWSHEATQFFFHNGTLLMVLIVALGQLPTQLVAADKMLGFFDLPLGHYYLVIKPCMFVESIGFTHSSYLLKDFLVWICKIDTSQEPEDKKMNKNWFYWARCIFSVLCVLFSGTMVIKGLAMSQTNATEGAGWRHLPGGAAVVVSLFFIFMLACAEGLQVSVIALATVPASHYRERAPLAYRTAKLALKGRNMSAFLVGRQFLTAMNMVLLARVTSYAGGEAGVLLNDNHDWGFGPFFNTLLQTGFIGAILVVNVAQLASQVTASIFPVAVINNYFMYWMLRLMLFIEYIGIVNACWPLAYLLDRAFDMNPDPPAEVTKPKKDGPLQTLPDTGTLRKLDEFHFHQDFLGMDRKWRKISYFLGSCLLTVGVLTVMSGIFQANNNPPWTRDSVPRFVEFILFWSMLFWIAMLEGCQISVVGLQGYDVEAFKDSHPRAYKCCKYVHNGPNVERFLVGRQFLLLFNGFLVSRIGGGWGELFQFSLFGWTWSHEATQFFFHNGTLLMIVIVALGQLPTQLVAADKMLGFFDLPLGHYYIVIMPCMFVESIGFTHSSYLLKDFLVWICKIDISQEPEDKKMNKNWFYWARCIFSVLCVCFSGTMVIKGLAMSQTNATEGAGWRHLPGGAAVVVSLFFIFMLACAEGLQVSVIALATVPGSSYKRRAPLAYRTAKLALRGRNMSAFLVGRQFLTAMNMVLLARVTSYAGGEAGVLLNDNHDWGFGPFFNTLLQTGFIGAILVVNVAQLASQVTASIFPVAVINNYFMYWMLRLMLFIEAIGIVNACWPLAYFLDRVYDMGPDPINAIKEQRATRGTDFTPKPAAGAYLDDDEEDPAAQIQVELGQPDKARPKGVYDGDATPVGQNQSEL